MFCRRFFIIQNLKQPFLSLTFTFRYAILFSANILKGGRAMRSFIKGFGGGLLGNLPLLFGGGICLLCSFVFDLLPLRLIAVSLFLAYALSTTFQGFFGLSKKGAQMSSSPDCPPAGSLGSDSPSFPNDPDPPPSSPSSPSSSGAPPLPSSFDDKEN